MVIVAIFAHPDDEAFGPAGTIATLAKEHNIYLLCATRGQVGQNDSQDETARLGKIRSDELRQSAKILGVKKVIFLGFKDGCLCNNNYHKLADKISKQLATIKPDTLLTFEPHGVSGHLDHIAVSMVTTFVFERLESAKKLWYYCISTHHRQFIKDYFIHFPPGYKASEINKTVDISSVWEKKTAAIKVHVSQKSDGKRMIDRLKKLPKEEYFLVRKK